MSGFQNELPQAVEDYMTKWQAFAANTQEQSLFAAMKPTAVGWKVADEAQYKDLYDQLRSLCDKTVETWMNGRWIAKLHLKETPLPGDIEIIKLMQRRPGSDDALGLDHMDFLCADIRQVEASLKVSEGIEWTWETNDVIENYDWISVWFDGTEAKIKQDTVIDIIIKELEEINNKIKH